MKKLFLVLLLSGLTLSPALLAEEAKTDEASAETAKENEDEDVTLEEEENTSYRFAPDFCDFEITLPEAPSVKEKCIPDGDCFEVNSYTMVYDLRTTVDVTVSCNPSTPAAFEKYTEPVMKAALAGMIENRNLTSHDVRFEEDKKAQVKSAALSGGGMTGRQEKIYTAQLWIGPNSVFTVQAELVGGEHADADKSFSDILSSIKNKKGKQVPRPKKTTIPQQNNQ